MTPALRNVDPGGDSLRSTAPPAAEHIKGVRVSPSEVPPIGDRIRAERARRGVTVRGLARDVGVSASLISQIETGRSQPSVSTLYAITTALGISIEDIFAPVPADLTPATSPQEDAAEYDTATVAEDAAEAAGPAAGGLPAHPGALAGQSLGTHAALTSAQAMAGQTGADGAHAPTGGTTKSLVADRGRRVGPVVRPDDREALTLDTGVVWELLGQVPDVHVDFMLVTYQPGGSSSSSGTLMRHSGIEYGYLISGELVLTLGFDEHHISAGDAISFDSTTPHGYRNEGNEPAVGVWFVLERVH
jgi:transcriptional regulator with XRE-family HTH domain/quercetin dioxygenase-like cupin family protein